MKRINSILLYLVLAILAVPFLYPLFFAVMSSLKTSIQIFSDPLGLPSAWLFSNYLYAWKEGSFSRYFFNSVFLTVASMALTVVITLLGCYILAKFKFKGNRFLYFFFIAGLMVPSQITIIPLAYVFGALRLRDNYAAIVTLFAAGNISLSVLVLTNFIQKVPAELEESAVLDGCTPLRILVSVISPLCVPAIASVSIFNFIAAWNSLLIPLVFIGKEELKTIPIGLLSFNSQYQSNYGGLMAAVVIAIALPIVAYLLLQEKVERGLVSGAVKG